MELIPLAILGVAYVAYSCIKLGLDHRNRKFGPDEPRQRYDPARWRRKRLRQRAQRVAEAQPGLVRLSGIARRKRLLVAPFSGREVIGYSLTLIAIDRERLRRPLFPSLTCLEDFYLDDESGSALIQADGARLLFCWSAPPVELGLPPETLTRALAAEGYDLADYHDYTQIQVVELLLLDNEEVAVSGEASSEIDPSGATAGSRSAPQLLVVRNTRKVPLLVANRAHEALRTDPPQAGALPVNYPPLAGALPVAHRPRAECPAASEAPPA